MRLRLLFIAWCFLVPFLGWAQFSQIRFEKLDSRDGLSHNRVTSIYKDQLGFMWFGTLSGLNRYDGSEVKVIQYDENDSNSLPNPQIVWIKEGPKEYLWIKTAYGVFAYDIFKERFVDITPLLAELQVNNYNLKDIVKDYKGNYWFVIQDIGVKKYISNGDEVYHYGGAYRNVSHIQPDNKGNMALVHFDGEIELVNIEDPRQSSFIQYPEHLENIEGLCTFIDADGDYWFYSPTHPFGVCCYNPTTKTCRHFDAKELGSHLVMGIIQDASSRIFIGVDHGGLTLISKDNWRLQGFVNNPSDPKSLSHNSIISMYQDRTGLIWIGTNKGGVNYCSPKSVAFSFYKQTESTAPNENDILPIVEDDHGNLWLGSDGAGLVHFNVKSGEFTNYRHDINDPESISSDIVVSMTHAADGGLWIGTYLGGLNYFNGKTFSHFTQSDDPNSISDNSIWKLHLDSEKKLWVGTLKNGIDVYDTNFYKVRHFDVSNRSIHSNYVTSFCEDHAGKMWIGTGYGVEIYNPKTGEFKHILKEEGNPGSLSNNSVLDIYCDHNGNIWVGTMYGINMLDEDANKIVNFTKDDGLPNNIVASILEDRQGNMWFGTYKGLSKLEREGDNPFFENFDISDGIQGDMFNERSALRLQNGNLAFGGKNGLNVFNPTEIAVSKSQNQLVFLEFYISNHQIKPGDEYDGRTWFENGINSTDGITLKPSENSFTVEFTALNFYQPENTVYKYRLKGFDKDWIVRSDINRANYTNLDPGSYQFEVMASDQSHEWSDAATLNMNIKVLTPFWKTTWAYASYAVAILLALLFTRRAIIQKERFRAKITHDQLEAKRLHELDLMKIKFFTNISHEFRTPLTLIMTPIERFLKSTEDPVHHKHFQLIYRNARRLLTLVNQLLDFRKMEANQHRMALSSGDLIEFVKNITESFSDLSNDRHIRLAFESGLKEFFTTFDRDKMEKIIFNLLSNAFKFTNPGGKIEVLIKEIAYQNEMHTIRITVRDNGIGIPRDQQDEVFNRFFQLERKETINLNHGNGIGLSITKEFVELHKGKIWVESEPEAGSSFIFELPMTKISEPGAVEEGWAEQEQEAIDPDLHEANKATIMLVDDNSDFRFYLKDNLKDIYNIYQAPNGKVAWKKIINQLPDLVVTDIMMPEINGIELCKKIKNDPRTAHIPVILLTAHYSDEQKLLGFEAGATEYITKPFNFEILVRAIQSAVQLQKFIHAAEHRVEAKGGEIEITPRDELFINQAIEAVEANISDPDFSVQRLSRELAVSRGQLYKKTLELTGKTPIEFIRSIRIKRAADLLAKSQLNVAEVAYKVGFNTPKYFTKYFKKEYKVLPSKYAASAKAGE